MILRAAAYLILQGPVTGTGTVGGKRRLLTLDARHGDRRPGLRRRVRQTARETSTADFILAYADWLAAHVEEWTVTTRGELVEGFPRHYIRINPTDPERPIRMPIRTQR